MSDKDNKNIIERPPVVVVMGHVDHGKSTLLDYMRKSNVVDGEAGGITQHINAYEIIHDDGHGTNKKITFLDTPGHAAFSDMRARGAKVADLAILIIAADDKVNIQTLEAYQTIIDSKTPFIVAINKIDKSGADVGKIKNELVEKGIYLEGFGGDITYVEISAKAGTGIDDLLETILLTIELEELKGDLSKPATGIVIESDLNEKRGISASLVIKDGTLKQGMFVVVDSAISGTRIFENSHGETIKEAHFSSPVRITGFSSPMKFLGLTKVPRVGEEFYSFETKKDAEKFMRETSELKDNTPVNRMDKDDESKALNIPIIIKADVLGTSEAIEAEIRKINCGNACFKIVRVGVGDISESDINFAQADSGVVIIGFNVKVEKTAMDLNVQVGATIHTSSIIYELTDWLKKEMENKRPRIETKEVMGQAKIKMIFSKTKDKQVVGGKMISGIIRKKDKINIIRGDEKIDIGKVIGIQQSKVDVDEIKEGLEFGIIIESKETIVGGDLIESFKVIEK